VAASYVMRTFSDAYVASVPTRADLDAVEARFPGTLVSILCAPGDRLSRHDQDVGSYRYCIVNMSAGDVESLHGHYAEVQRMLPFVLRPALASPVRAR
jgi:hypothetical protein